HARARRPAVDQRREDALAHDAGDDRPGQALLARGLVVVEARKGHARRAGEAAHVGERHVGRERGELLAELDLFAAAPAHCQARCTMRQSTIETGSPRWLENSMRWTMKSIVPERPVLV